MARGVNKVILIGNLGQDPETRYTPNGNPVVNLSLATSETWKDRNTGQPQEKTEWHRVVMFGKVAEVAAEYLRKGSKIYLEGKLQTRKWQGQDGQDRYTTEVVVDMGGTMQMLDSGQGSQGGRGGQQPAGRGQGQGEAYRQASGGTAAAGHQSGGYAQPGGGQGQGPAPVDDFDDDIPF